MRSAQRRVRVPSDGRDAVDVHARRRAVDRDGARDTIERLPARSLATSLTVVRPSGSFGSSANAPLRGCMTTCLPE